MTLPIGVPNNITWTGGAISNPANVLTNQNIGSWPPSANLVVKLGTIAINPATKNAYIVTSRAGGTTTWTIFASGSGGDVLSVTGTANQILASPTTGAVVLSLIGPYTPATYTAHGVLLGEGTSSIAATAAGSNGQVLLGSTAADPAFGTLTTSTGIAYTTGAHALAIDVQNDGFAIVDQTTGSATLAKQTTYVTDNGASLVTYTLPLAANATQGMVYRVTGGSAGGWSIAQNASQTIHLGTQNSTTGTGGSVSSNGRYASLTLQCINATGLDFVVIASSGNFTVV